MVTVKIGPQAKIFRIHKDVLCAKSEYFKRSLNGKFAEAVTSVVTLDDADEMVFTIISTWLYDGQLRLFDGDNDKISAMLVKYKKCSMHPDTPTTWPWQLVIDLCIFADRYRISGMEIVLLDALRGISFTPDYAMITAAYSMPSEDLRSIVVDRFVALKYDAGEKSDFDELPNDFKYDIVNKLLKVCNGIP